VARKPRRGQQEAPGQSDGRSYQDGERGPADILDPYDRALAWADRMLASGKLPDGSVHLPDVGWVRSGGQVFVERNREMLARSIAIIRDPKASTEAIRQANATAVRAVFCIADIKGALEAILCEREHGPRVRTAPWRKGRAHILPRQMQAFKQACEERGWRPEKLTTAQQETIAEAMDRDPRTIRRYARRCAGK
jgi:hypothetical protein